MLVLCLLGVAVLGAGVSGASAADGSLFELRPGVVVDRTRGTLYLATPEGGIEAVAMANGRSQWKSEAATVPLAVVDRWLVSRSEAAEPGFLPIVGL